MKKTKFRRLAAMAASLLCCLIFTVPAYAQSSEPQPETAPSPAETEAEPETQNPFTPDGTGTVVDNATDEDGKEFYTITTADESVFYLVIDKQKTSENVYFLNTVTTDDLLPLAEQGKEPPKEVTPEPEPKPTEPVEEVPEPEPEKKDSPLLSLLLIGTVGLAGVLVNYSALSLADALDDHLLCSLSCNAAEFLGLYRNFDSISELCALADLLCRLDVYLQSGIFHLLNGDLVYIHFYALSAFVKQYVNIIRTLGIIAAECRQHCLLYLVVHIISGNTLFFFEILNCREKFSVHFNIPLLFIWSRAA